MTKWRKLITIVTRPKKNFKNPRYNSLVCLGRKVALQGNWWVNNLYIYLICGDIYRIISWHLCDILVLIFLVIYLFIIFLIAYIFHLYIIKYFYIPIILFLNRKYEYACVCVYLSYIIHNIYIKRWIEISVFQMKFFTAFILYKCFTYPETYKTIAKNVHKSDIYSI